MCSLGTSSQVCLFILGLIISLPIFTNCPNMCVSSPVVKVRANLEAPSVLVYSLHIFFAYLACLKWSYMTLIHTSHQKFGAYFGIHFANIFFLFGLPQMVLHDLNSYFTSNIWCIIWDILGIKVLFTSAYQP